MTGIGFKRTEPRKPMKRGGPIERRTKLKPVSRHGRQVEMALAILKKLIIQEYVEGTSFIPKGGWHQYDMDHIHGRHEPGFGPLTAMFNPKNLQLLCRFDHNEKTSPTNKGEISQRADLRPTEIQDRLTKLAERLEKKLPPGWRAAKDLLVFKRILSSETYCL